LLLELLFLLLLLLILAGQPGERTGRSRHGLYRDKRYSETYRSEERPAFATLRFQHSPLPVTCGFISREYKRFFLNTLVPMT
jgi:hypothetical protein